MEIARSSLAVHNGCAYFCIAHVEPFFLLPHYFNLIKTQDFLCSHRGPCFSVKSFLGSRGISPVDSGNTSEYAPLLIQDLLSSHIGRIGAIYISNHRKILVSRNIGTVSRTYLPNYDGIYVAEKDDVKDFDLDFSEREKVMVTAPVVFHDGVIGQYAGAHSISDFLRFSLVCREGGVLNDRELVDFIRCNVFFPVLFLGYFPSAFFKIYLDKFVTFFYASEKFKFKLYNDFDPYQKRARAFFMERLLSFLFIRLGLEFGILTQRENNLQLTRLDIGKCVVLKSVNKERDYIIGL